MCAGLLLEPTFDVPLVNVTVVAGQSIVLQCSIDNLGKFKVRVRVHQVRIVPRTGMSR